MSTAGLSIPKVVILCVSAWSSALKPAKSTTAASTAEPIA